MKHTLMLLATLLLMLPLSAMQQHAANAGFDSIPEEENYNTNACCDDIPTSIEIKEKPDKPAVTKAAKKIQTGIVGRWENTIYPFEVDDAGIIPGAFLRYEFQANGSYVKIVGNAEYELQEKGTWEVSADGSHLIMESKSGEVSQAMIKHLQLDELVLEHELKVKDSAFCTKQKDFFFNKQ